MKYLESFKSQFERIVNQLPDKFLVSFFKFLSCLKIVNTVKSVFFSANEALLRYFGTCRDGKVRAIKVSIDNGKKSKLAAILTNKSSYLI